jgi:hypothetical protein
MKQDALLRDFERINVLQYSQSAVAVINSLSAAGNGRQRISSWSHALEWERKLVMRAG